MGNIQIFGLRSSQDTRAAQRFFAERRIAVQFVDLSQKAMAPRELRRFAEKFGLRELADAAGKAYEDAGLKYLKVSDAEFAGKLERDPKLLRLPLVRGGDRVSIGRNEAGWKEMLV